MTWPVSAHSLLQSMLPALPPGRLSFYIPLKKKKTNKHFIYLF